MTRNTPSSRVGERIATLRTRRGMTQRELADALNVSSSEVVSRWERGEREPRIETLHAIASALGVPVGDLVGGATPPWMNELVWGPDQGSTTIIGTVYPSPIVPGTPGQRDAEDSEARGVLRATRIPNPGSPALRPKAERDMLDELIRRLEGATPRIRDAACRVALATLAELENLDGETSDSH